MKSRKRSQVDSSSYCPRVNLITIILAIAALCLVSALALYHRTSTSTTSTLSSTSGGIAGVSANTAANEEYHRLVKRAHRLLRKYKALRGGNTTLPAHLASFQLPDLPPSQGSSSSSGSSHGEAGEEDEEEEEEQQHVVQTYPMQSTARDAVLGMAYDIDTKNLVIYVPSLLSISKGFLLTRTGWFCLCRLSLLSH